MPQRRWIVVAALAAALIALGVGWRRYDRKNVGIPDFYLWKVWRAKPTAAGTPRVNGPRGPQRE